MALSDQVLKKADELYNQYLNNKTKWVKKYKSEAPKVMKGSAIKNAKKMIEKDQKQRIKEIIKTALTKGPVEEIDSTAFIKTQKPVAPLPIPDKREKNPMDVIMMDVPLMIRLLEYAREDAKEDVDLHNVAENLVMLSKNGRVLDMTDYVSIISPDDSID